jgi:hypothetical protein
VLQQLKGIDGGTHLNDVLRSLAEVLTDAASSLLRMAGTAGRVTRQAPKLIFIFTDTGPDLVPCGCIR